MRLILMLLVVFLVAAGMGFLKQMPVNNEAAEQAPVGETAEQVQDVDTAGQTVSDVTGEQPADAADDGGQTKELLSKPLPIDFSGGFPPDEKLYNGDTSYEDPTIKVEIKHEKLGVYSHIFKGRDVEYWVADIRIGDASQLRTAAAESFDTDTALPANEIAERVNAVLAFNGDFVSRLKDGFTIRQGKLFRDKLKGQRDVLLIDEDGDFHAVHSPDKGQLSDTVDGKKVINAFYFGPILVENGEVVQNMPSFTYLCPEKYYARMAICQVGHLHYKVIATTMEKDYTLGLKLFDFANLCKQEGAKIAYNLDGGQSTTLYFNHKRQNEQNRVNFRNIPDIIYFASAWNGENNI